LMECMPFGSVQQRLLERDPQRPQDPLPFMFDASQDDRTRLENLRIVCRVLVDSSSALEHLHAQGIVHCDIAARNFLLGSTNRAVLADFGLSRALPRPDLQEDFLVCPDNVPLPTKWCAPETLGKRLLSRQTDVYSFGVYMSEVMSRQAPYQGLDLPMSELVAGIHQVHDPFRPVIADECPLVVASIMRDCWQADASTRPSISAVNRRLEHFLTSATEAERLDQVYFPINNTVAHAAASAGLLRPDNHSDSVYLAGALLVPHSHSKQQLNSFPKEIYDFYKPKLMSRHDASGSRNNDVEML